MQHRRITSLYLASILSGGSRDQVSGAQIFEEREIKPRYKDNFSNLNGDDEILTIRKSFS
ncbi:hypothetical protein BN2476_940010 [Paraburkholderia piptadeniae]|uniref:Uncharacterized protein n=1 Tax=Paraburkholderia piptadeniae TaxID=1701573 RepID=A0A1N7STN9_9BURK|nr:hypothetical protein BN2476_940010 [Paraburkholderia piptadeniae]